MPEGAPRVGDAPPVGVGVIGCGSIAVTAHLPALAKLGGAVALRATADVDADAAERAAAGTDAVPYRDYRALLDRDDVDLVVLATPEFLHREQTVAAAAAGKHVLCEKPMASTLEDADAMLAACRAAGVRLMVGHSRRATARYRIAKRMIEAGDVGEVRLFRENERRQRPPLGRASTYWRPDHWTGDPARSVGVALTNAIHETDLGSWLLDARPVSVFAESRTAREGNLVPDFLSLSVRYEGGAVAAAEVNNSAPPGYPGFHQFEIHGAEGSITAKDMDQQALTLYRDEGASSPGAFDRLLRFNDAYVAQLAAMVAAVRHGAEVPVPPEQARLALRVALAAVESAREHEVVLLDEPEPS